MNAVVSYFCSTQIYKSFFQAGLGLWLVSLVLFRPTSPDAGYRKSCLVVNPTSVTGSGNIGTTFAMDQTVSITSSNSTPIDFTVTTKPTTG